MINGLVSAVDELLGADMEGLEEGELHAAVVELQRQSARLAAVRARFVSEWDRRRVWASDGSKSPSARLGRACGLSAKAARVEVKRARRLRTMPVTTAALVEGRVSVDHVDALAVAHRPEVSKLFARDEAVLVKQAQALSFPDFRRALDYWGQHADAAGAEERAARVHEGRYVQVADTLDGTVDLVGLLDPVAGAIVRNELERLEQALFEADWTAARAEHGEGVRSEHLARTHLQRRADALVEMARRSATPRLGAPPARPLLTVLVGYETFAGRVCELANGTVVTPGQIVPLLAEADIERVVFDGPSRVIEVGRRRRCFCGALRRAIEVRDRHCTHPGCTVPAERCQVDHVKPYALGGETTQANGRLLCPAHNRGRESERYENRNAVAPAAGTPDRERAP